GGWGTAPVLRAVLALVARGGMDGRRSGTSHHPRGHDRADDRVGLKIYRNTLCARKCARVCAMGSESMRITWAFQPRRAAPATLVSRSSKNMIDPGGTLDVRSTCS